MQNRRDFMKAAGGLIGTGFMSNEALEDLTDSRTRLKLKYMVSSCLYGYMDLETVFAEVRKSGATAIDIWPKVHGNQREQLDEIGEEKFKGLLKKHNISLGCITQYKLGPFALKEELQLAKRLGCKLLITGAKGDKSLEGAALKNEVKKFVTNLQPTIEQAEENGVVVAIENHSSTIIHTPDSIKWFLDFILGKNIGLALAPYHLDQHPQQIAEIIHMADTRLALFYAWQHGKGSMGNVTSTEILEQFPGKGSLDFVPILAALKAIKFDGWTEIFMHSFPRGTSVKNTASGVTAELNESRKYMEQCISKI